MSLQNDIDNFKVNVSSSITDKTAANSISPQDVGNAFSDLADLLTGSLADTYVLLQTDTNTPQTGSISIDGQINIGTILPTDNSDNNISFISIGDGSNNTLKTINSLLISSGSLYSSISAQFPSIQVTNSPTQSTDLVRLIDLNNAFSQSLLNADNGLSINNSTIQLGGTLNKDTIIDQIDKQLIIYSENLIGNSQQFISNPYGFTIQTFGTSSYSILSNNSNNILIGTSFTGSTRQIIVAESGLVINDNFNEGLQYANDYGAYFSTNNRSIPDTAWVINRIASGSTPISIAGGELTGSYPNPSLLNSAVISKTLTGFVAAPGTVGPNDDILQAFEKIVGNVGLLTGNVTFKGTWDANTNTPPLTSSVGTNGDLYLVSVSGSTNLDSINSWQVFDAAVFGNGAWQKIGSIPISVLSVFGRTGNVVLLSSDVTGALGYVPYNSTNPAGYISLNSLSATSPILYNSASGVIFAQSASAIQNGYITSADYNSFISKQNALTGSGFVKSTGGVISYDTSSYISSTDLSLYAPKLNPIFTGSVTIPTSSLVIGSTLVITTGNQLNYLNLANGTTGNVNSGLVFSNSPTLLGIPQAPTANINSNDTQIATTAFVNLLVSSSSSTAQQKLNGLGFVKAVGTTISYDPTTYAPLDSPHFVGIPIMPSGTLGFTQNANDSSDKLATTLFVQNNLLNAVVKNPLTNTQLINGNYSNPFILAISNIDTGSNSISTLRVINNIGFNGDISIVGSGATQPTGSVYFANNFVLSSTGLSSMFGSQNVSQGAGAFIFSGGTGSANIHAGFLNSGWNWFDRINRFGDSNLAYAVVDIKGGTTTIPSLILNSGSLLDSPLSGSIENDGTNLYYTDNNKVRRILSTNSPYSASNGLTLSGSNTFQLGGTLIKNTDLNLSTNQIRFLDSTGNTNLYINKSGSNSIDNVVFDRSGSGNYSELEINYNKINSRIFYGNATTDITFSSESLLINDGINSFGLLYNANYSTNGTLNDRWIPDWGTVKSYVSSSSPTLLFDNGLTNNSGTIILGGTLTGNTVIEQVGNILTFNYISANSSVEDQLILGASNGFNSLSNSTPITTLSGDDYTISTINNWDGALAATAYTANYGFQNYNIIGGFQSLEEISDNTKRYFKPFFTVTVEDSTRISGIYEKPKGFSTLDTFAPALGSVTYIPYVGIFVADLIDSIGLQYVEDYSANNTSNPRWIPDKAYIDGAITAGIISYSANNGVTQSGNTFEIGGSLIQNTTINLGTTPTFTLGFLNGDITVNGLTVGKGKNFKSGNTALGVIALSSITTGNSNTAVGNASLKSTTTGANNVAIGSQALTTNIAGNSNTAIGTSALSTITGNSNIGIGASALISATSASNNTVIGAGAGQNSTFGSSNTIIGASSALAQTTANNNTMIGYGAGGNFVAGANGSSNIFIGYQAGYSETGSNKLYICNNSSSTPLIGGDFSTSQLTINGKLIITDSSLNGAIYNADYSTSGSQNLRWIPDLGYVKTLISSSNIIDNGLTLSGSHIQLGGTLTKQTTITNSSQQIVMGSGGGHGLFEIIETLSAQANIDLAIGDNLIKGVAGSFAGIYMGTSDTDWGQSFIALSKDKLQLFYSDPTNKVSGFIVDNTLTGSFGIQVKDTFNSTGLVYVGNYAANNTSNPRWIPDKAYVDGVVAGGVSGSQGPSGSTGAGVVTGGTAGQILAKIDSTNYNTHWIDQVTGSLTGGTINFIPLWTGTNSQTSSIIIQTGSNIGINNTNPQFTLDISGSSRISNNLIISGTLNVVGGITGSLLGTSSYNISSSHSDLANTASYVLNAVSSSYSSISQTANTASYVLNAVSASYATTSQTANTSSYVVLAQTASFVNLAQTSNTASYVTLAQTASYIALAISSSYAIISQTSNTASYILNAVSSSNSLSSSYALTASLLLGSVQSASYATIAQTANTASYVTLAQTASFVNLARSASYSTQSSTASYILNAVSASYSTQASTASFTLNTISASYAIKAQTANTASYVLNAVSASYATQSQVAITAISATSSITANTASYVLNAVSASFANNSLTSSITLIANTASYVTLAQSALIANTASYVTLAQTASFLLGTVASASYALTAGTASYVLNALTASYVLNAVSSSRALLANTASYILNAVSASYANNSTTASYALTASLLLGSVVSASYAATASYVNQQLYFDQFSITGSGIISDPIKVHNFRTVVNYSTMVSLGTPTSSVMYKVTNDEHRGTSGSLYIWWSDNKRVFISSSADN